MTDLAKHIDHEVTIEGTTADGAAGAIVITSDRTPVYVDGLRHWDRAIGTAVRLTGVLRKRPGDRVIADNGEHSHGIPDDQYILELWEVT